jgi:hypothetical protein
MPKTLFVSLNVTYRELASTAKGQDSVALRNCTCVAWHVNPASATGVAYLVGVFSGKAVSVYRVTEDVTRWPVIPDGALGGGRRCVPVVAVSPADWAAVVTSWPRIEISGALRYGNVNVTPAGALTTPTFDERPLLQDEIPGDANDE